MTTGPEARTSINISEGEPPPVRPTSAPRSQPWRGETARTRRLNRLNISLQRNPWRRQDGRGSLRSSGIQRPASSWAEPE